MTALIFLENLDFEQNAYSRTSSWFSGEVMENVEKLRVLLQHWIDHNKGHAEEFAKWQKLMTDDAKGVIADHIGEAIKEMGKGSEHLARALKEAGGPKEGDGGDDHHHHGDGHHHHH